MSGSEGEKRHGTYVYKRFIWPYVMTVHPDGEVEVLVKDAICPRCRLSTKVTQTGGTVLVRCLRCNISMTYSPYSSYDELKAAVAEMIERDRGD